MYCAVKGPKRYSIFIKYKDKNIKKGGGNNHKYDDDDEYDK